MVKDGSGFGDLDKNILMIFWIVYWIFSNNEMNKGNYKWKKKLL